MRGHRPCGRPSLSCARPTTEDPSKVPSTPQIPKNRVKGATLPCGARGRAPQALTSNLAGDRRSPLRTGPVIVAKPRSQRPIKNHSHPKIIPENRVKGATLPCGARGRAPQASTSTPWRATAGPSTVKHGRECAGDRRSPLRTGPVIVAKPRSQRPIKNHSHPRIIPKNRVKGATLPCGARGRAPQALTSNLAGHRRSIHGQARS